MVRAAFIDKNSGLIKGAWSREEDDKLRAYVLRYGDFNWRLVPKYAGLNRCGKSCRLRWMNYLQPNVKRGNFTREEGELIKKLHDELGNKWSVIASNFSGRTDNEIKNFWHTRFNKRNRVKSSQIAAHSTNSSEILSPNLKEENYESSKKVYIFESSVSNSNSGGSCGANWDMGSTKEHNWSCETSFEPSFEMFQESFVVDTSYIQEFDFPSYENCMVYYNHSLELFDDDDEMRLFEC